MADVKNTQAIFSALCESRATRRERAVKVESKATKNESTGVEMFTGRLLQESIADKGIENSPGNLIKKSIRSVFCEDDNDVVEDIIDNIVVVTDPDKSVDDLEGRADDIQDAIEGSAEGEAAFSDEYVGDKVYACPICGESFFADEDYSEGDTCPICKAEPADGFLCQGVVSAIEPEVQETAEVEETTDEVEAADDTENEVEAANESVVKSDDQDQLEEGLFGFGKKSKGKKPMDVKSAQKKILDAAKNSSLSNKEMSQLKTRMPAAFISKAIKDDSFDFDKIDSVSITGNRLTVTDKYSGEISTSLTESVEKDDQIDVSTECTTIVTESDEPAVQIEIEVNAPKEPEAPQYVEGVTFDEDSFNTCLNDFAEENYGDCLDSLNVDEVVYIPQDDSLRVECKAVTKAGDEVPVSLKLQEEECDGAKAKLTATESTNVFKIESKKPAFEFNVRKVNGAIRCESMKYGYVTTHSTAGRVKVEGFSRSRRGRK